MQKYLIIMSVFWKTSVLFLWIQCISLGKTEISCEPPPDIIKATISPRGLTEYPINTVLEYSCVFGYRPSQVLQTTKCVEGEDPDTAVWTDIELSCILSCGPPPELKRAIIAPKGLKEYPVNTVLKYSCDFGYVTSQILPTTKCVKGEDPDTAVWTDIELNCIPRSCGDPGSLNHGRVNGSLFSFPHHVAYICDEGFQLHGTSKRFCQTNGEWSGRPPSCVTITCNEPEHPENGNVKYDSLEYGSVLRYECKKGFRPDDQKERSCDSNGRWSGSTPNCVETYCDPPETPEYGAVRLTGGNVPKVDSVAFYQCNDGRKLIGALRTKCLETGQWSFPSPKCVELCTVPDISNGYLIKYRRGYTDKIPVGTEIEDVSRIYLRCDGKFQPNGQNVRDLSISCHDGTWSVEPKCMEVSCTTKAPVVSHAILITPETHHGVTLTYYCYSDYYKAKFGAVKCVHGSWIGETPICKDSRCYINALNFPGIEPSQRGVFKNRTTIKPQCREKFTKSERADGVMKCINGEWQGAIPPCFAAGCNTLPLIPENGKIETYSGLHGSAVKYSCNYYFTLKDSSKPVTCEFGTWKGEPPECKDSRCYLEDLPNKSGLDLTHSGPAVSGHLAEISCLKGYALQYRSKPRCLDGKWQQRNGLSPCQESDCEVTDLKNGKFEFATTSSRYCYSCFGRIVETTYSPARERSRQKHGTTLYVGCTKPSIFNGNDNSKHVSVKCEKGQWNPSPHCLLPGERPPAVTDRQPNVAVTVPTQPSTTSSTASAQRTSKAPTPVPDLEEGAKEELDAEDQNACLCTYNTLDEDLIAYAKNKELKYGDKIKQNCTVYFQCRRFGFHRLIGVKELTCRTCSWHSSEFPSCVEPNIGDPVIDVTFSEENSFAFTPNGTLLIRPNVDINIACHLHELVSDDAAVSLKGPRSILTEHKWTPYRNGHLSTVYFYIRNVQPNSNGKYICTREAGLRPHQVDIVIEDWRCPDIEGTDGLAVAYGIQENHKVALFSCYDKNKVLVGPNSITCLGSGDWSADVPICKHVTECPELNETEGLDIDYVDGRKINSTATFHCIEPYRRKGAAYITCMANGEWTEAPPECSSSTCIVESVFDVLPPIATVNLGNITAQTLPEGTSFDIICQEDNHRIIGDRVVTCMESGKWFVGSIQCVLGCDVMKRSVNSTLIIQPNKEVYKFGEFATFACPPGQELTSDVERVLCFQGGWSHAFPECQDIPI